MTKRRDSDTPAGPVGRLAHWLQSLRAPVAAPAPADAAPPDDDTARRLLQRAADCYAREGWAEDACRVFTALGDDRHAAPYHERLGNWQAAALCFANVQEWRAAARCWQEARRWDQAAECLERAGDFLQAAWTWAHLAQAYIRADGAVNRIPEPSPSDQRAIRLVQARCAAGRQHHEQAGRLLGEVLAEIGRSPPADWHRLAAWILTVGNLLERPDVPMTLHALAVHHGLPAAQRDWEVWAEQTLGPEAVFLAAWAQEKTPVERDGNRALVAADATRDSPP